MKNNRVFIILFLVAVAAGIFFDKSWQQNIISKVPEEKKKLSIDSLPNKEIPEFVNAINMPVIELPFVSNLVSKESRDTLDYDLSGKEENIVFKLFIKGRTEDTLILTGARGFELYEEGDVNADGVTDIGFMASYPSSSCRGYQVLTFRNNKIKTLYDISTHLPDREMGVDYIRNEGNRIRIIQADDGCCQCLGLDTSYKKINN